MPMPDTIPLDIPDGATLRQLREEIGLSQTELADELGFKESGADVVRAWEKGERSGKPCHPTPLAWRCFRLIVILWRATRAEKRDAWDFAYDHLSERLR
jgi:DNA-binding XRE family transcriptional regulator